MKVLLVVICKCENNYILEFVNHYKNLGFTNIVIGDNNNIDGESIDTVLSGFVDSGFVHIENYRGKIKIQNQFYTDMYEKYHNDYDWIAFFDADEYLVMNNASNVQDFLEQEIYKNFDVIRLNWMCFGDNGLVRVINNDYSLQTRFTNPSDDKCVIKGMTANQNCKAFVKGHIDGLKIDVHGNYSLKNCCNDIGEKIENKWFTNKVSHKNAYLKHYNTKTIEEWANKIKRGYPDKNYNNKNMLSFDRFFKFNKRTKEKDDYVKMITEKWKKEDSDACQLPLS